MSKRKYQIGDQEIGRYEINLLNDAGALAEAAHGTRELYGEQPERIRQSLKARLTDWKPTPTWAGKEWIDYDNAVRALCEAALALDAWRTKENKNCLS